MSRAIHSMDFVVGELSARLFSVSKQKNSEVVVICHGFASNQNSSKIQLIKDWALKHEKSVITFDFCGHGESGGRFGDLTITRSSRDTNSIIDHAIRNLHFQRIILVGFSYGGLVATVVTSQRSDIYRLVLISSLIDYHEKEMLLNRQKVIIEWAKTGIREYIINDARLYLDYAYYKDSLQYSAYSLLKNSGTNVTLVHAENDEMVPYQQAVRLAKEMSIDLYTIKGSDHRLSTLSAKEELVLYLDNFAV